MTCPALARRSAGHRGAMAHVHEDGGFTLAEAIVAFTLFIIMSTAATYALVTTIRLSGVTQNRVAAANLAAQALEQLRLQNNATSQLDASVRTVTLHGTTFTVTPALAPSATSTCALGSSRKVTVIVTWPGSGSRSPRYDSVLTC